MNLIARLAAAAAAVLALATLGACSKAPQSEVATAPLAAASANVSDIDVTEHVKTTLLQTESLKGQEIAVVTINGDVRLTGTLATQAQIDEALRIARAAEGAHTIHDELTLRK
jgi:hyperosmotically inducible periplasmic protein